MMVKWRRESSAYLNQWRLSESPLVTNQGGCHVCTQSIDAFEDRWRSGIQEENGERSDSHSAQAGGVPRRNHLPLPQRKRSSCLQYVGNCGARGGLQS